MKWALLIVPLLLAAPAQSKPPGEDMSVHELVMNYIHLPCGALIYSYGYMYREMTMLTSAYQICATKQRSSVDPTVINDQWFGLQCSYIHQYWQLRYEHIMSVAKAWNLMCNEEGRKEEQYEIQF